MVSCDKDPEEEEEPANPNKEANYSLEGTWNATSALINDQETFGPNGLTTKYSTTYKPSGDIAGNYTIDATILDTDTTITGSYEVSGEGKIITLTDTDGEKTVADITIESNTYTVSYTEDGNKTVIKATKQ